MTNIGFGLGFNKKISNTAVPTFTGALDGLPSSAAAFSTRRLRSGHTGPLMRVRRSSDNAEADIGYTVDGGLDTTALLAHVGAGSGFVTTWYDQSGNSRNALQGTAGNQYRIVNAGAYDGQLTASVTTASLSVPITTFNNSSPFSLLFVLGPFRQTASGVLNYLFTVGDGSTTSRRVVFGAQTASAAMAQRITTTVQTWGANFDADAQVLSFVKAGTTNMTGATARINGGAALTGPSAGLSTFTMSEVTIGSRGVPTAFDLREFVIFDSQISDTNRQTLEGDQMSYYGITP